MQKRARSRPRANTPEFAPWNLSREQPIRLVDHAMSAAAKSPFHVHDVLEIGWCRGGSGIFVIDATAFAVTEGDVVIIPPLAAHTAYGAGEASRWTYAFVQVRHLLGAALDPRLALVDGAMFRPSANPHACALAKRVIEETQERRDLWREAAKASLAALLVELRRAAGPKADRRPPRRTLKRMRTIEPALRLIAERYAEPIGVPALARACGIGGSQLRRLFTEQIGASPIDYLLAHRIEVASCLLADARSSIIAIANATGFQSLSSFNRQFRLRLGCSPREWRKRL